MKPPNSTLNRGTSQLSRAKAGNLKRSRLKPKHWWNPTRSSRPKRGRKRRPWKSMLETIFTRAAGHCERCKRTILKVNATPQNVHHILARSQGGSNEPKNLAFLCAPMQYFGRTDKSCHTFCHSEPKAARTEGWVK